VYSAKDMDQVLRSKVLKQFIHVSIGFHIVTITLINSPS